jgi:hypothetical protein
VPVSILCCSRPVKTVPDILLPWLGYHSGPRSFGIGLENAGLLVEAFQSVSTSPDPIADAPNALTTVLTRVLTPINDLCVGMAAELGIQVLLVVFFFHTRLL